MKKGFVCDKGHEFLYAAIRIETFPKIGDFSPQVDSFETHVCPFCQSLRVSEVEPEEPTVESVKQVNYDEVDALLKQGYTVQSYYASKVTMTKCKAEAKQP